MDSKPLNLPNAPRSTFSFSCPGSMSPKPRQLMPPLYRIASWPLKPTQSDDFAVVQIYVVSQSLKTNSIYIERRKHFLVQVIVHRLS